MEDKWDARFLTLAESIATWSKDPSRGVGAVIVSPLKQVIATGYNGLPRGFADHEERLQRPVKYDLTVHAEMNAIIQCARNGVSPIDGTVYSTFSPCIHCSLSIVQAGITRVVTWAVAKGDEHWSDSIEKSLILFEETGIEYIAVERPSEC
ncbi:MAG: dCMP deaminase family protein [Planctomycetes bacterium]|nr:dCMP deaminase family protein [Planctomycetota bacterium]